MDSSSLSLSSPDKPLHFLLIDGHKRVRALQKLHRDEVSAYVWNIPEIDAMVLTYKNQSQGEWNAIEEGNLISVLIRQQGHTLASVAQMLLRSKSWVSRRLGMIETLPDTVLERLRVKVKKQIKTEMGKEALRMRGFNVETPFGEMKHNHGFRRFVLRSLPKVNIEIGLFFSGYNIAKMWRNSKN